jgi:hypothetical protein
VVDLETNNITILNLTLSKSELLLHQLDHARLDFLQPIKSEYFSRTAIQLAHLKQLQRSTRCPPHPLINQRVQILDFAVPRHIHLTNAEQGLLRHVKVLEENHDGSRWWLRLQKRVN